MARRFHAEIILLHVVTPFSYPAGWFESGHEITARDLHAHVVQRAQKDLEQAPLPEFDGIAVTRLLLRGDPAREIAEMARTRNVDLIVMATHDVGPFYPLLLGSVTAKVLHETQCPVWTGAHLEQAPEAEFSIRRVLCSVELNGHSRHTVSLAAEMAAAVDATLTLVHITSSVEFWGPGGSHVNPEWKKTIVGFAAEEIAATSTGRRHEGRSHHRERQCPATAEPGGGANESRCPRHRTHSRAEPSRRQRRGLRDHSAVTYPGTECLTVRTPLIAANWKMHKDLDGTKSFFRRFLPLVERAAHCDIVICPSFLDVENAVNATRGTRVRIGAQNLYWENEGAFTGEVSGPMIKASGCSHVIVGHSERRRYFGETNETVSKKTRGRTRCRAYSDRVPRRAPGKECGNGTGGAVSMRHCGAFG